MPNGQTFGDAVLTPTPSYSTFVRGLLHAGVEVHALLPGTGGGVAKLAFDKRSFTYYVHTWPQDVPPIFDFIREVLHVGIPDMLTTFNCGVGYYAFVPARDVDGTIRVAKQAGHKAMEVGEVREGERVTIFGPAADLRLPPPGE